MMVMMTRHFRALWQSKDRRPNRREDTIQEIGKERTTRRIDKEIDEPCCEHALQLTVSTLHTNYINASVKSIELKKKSSFH